jgi:hypothetical protein
MCLLGADALVLTLEDGPVERPPGEERSHSRCLNGLRHGAAMRPRRACPSTGASTGASAEREGGRQGGKVRILHSALLPDRSCHLRNLSRAQSCARSTGFGVGISQMMIWTEIQRPSPSRCHPGAHQLIRAPTNLYIVSMAKPLRRYEIAPVGPEIAGEHSHRVVHTA